MNLRSARPRQLVRTRESRNGYGGFWGGFWAVPFLGSTEVPGWPTRGNASETGALKDQDHRCSSGIDKRVTPIRQGVLRDVLTGSQLQAWYARDGGRVRRIPLPHVGHIVQMVRPGKIRARAHRAPRSPAVLPAVTPSRRQLWPGISIDKPFLNRTLSGFMGQSSARMIFPVKTSLTLCLVYRHGRDAGRGGLPGYPARYPG